MTFGERSCWRTSRRRGASESTRREDRASSPRASEPHRGRGSGSVLRKRKALRGPVFAWHGPGEAARLLTWPLASRVVPEDETAASAGRLRVGSHIPKQCAFRCDACVSVRHAVPIGRT